MSYFVHFVTSILRASLEGGRGGGKGWGLPFPCLDVSLRGREREYERS
jgi:hypothetical protein